MPRLAPGTPPPLTRAALGAWGEALAAEWCLAQGWELLARNAHARTGELDLILRDGDRIAFCEVRTRRHVSSGPTALESIDARKQRKLQAAAEAWLAALPAQPAAWHFHFDVFLLEPEPHGAWILTHLPDAFSPIDPSTAP